MSYINSYCSLAARRPFDMPSVIGNRREGEIVKSPDLAISTKDKLSESRNTSRNMYDEVTKFSTDCSDSGYSTNSAGPGSSSNILNATALSSLPQGPTQLELWAQENERHEDIAYRLTVISPQTRTQPLSPTCLKDQQDSSSGLKERNTMKKMHIDSQGFHLALLFEGYVDGLELDLGATWHDTGLSYWQCWDGF